MTGKVSERTLTSAGTNGPLPLAGLAACRDAMSTTDLDQSAGAGAAPAAEQGETAPPELQTAGDAHQQTDAEGGADQSQGADDEADKGLSEAEKTIRKLTRRIERLTAKRGASEREAELLRQQLAEVQRGAQSQRDEGGDSVRQITEADIERVARQKADEIARQRTIGEKVGKVLKEGAKVEGFNAAVDTVAEVVPFMDRVGKPTPFIEAVLDADNPAAVLKYLGDNPEEAEELADLTPAQLGRRIAKLEIQIAGAKKTTSAAPTPIRPVGGNHAGPSEPDPDKDPAAWIQARNRAAVRAR